MLHMRIGIYYFSGTGNTAYVAKKIASSFWNQGAEVTLYPIGSKEEIPDPSSFDALGFGYPIHAFNAPETMIRFVKGLPAPSSSKRAFIFKVSGEPYSPNKASSHLLSSILKKKGIEVSYERHFLMPYNILFRYPDEVVKEMLLSVEPYAALLVDSFLSGKENPPSFPPDKVAFSFLLRIEWLAPKVNRPFFRVKEKRCIRCGLCVNHCPQHALRMDEEGKIHMGKGCALCMNCADHCPKDAIRFGIFNGWKVSPFYDYPKIMGDPSIASDTIRKGRKDYYRHFRKYYQKEDELTQKMEFGPRKEKP